MARLPPLAAIGRQFDAGGRIGSCEVLLRTGLAHLPRPIRRARSAGQRRFHAGRFYRWGKNYLINQIFPSSDCLSRISTVLSIDARNAKALAIRAEIYARSPAMKPGNWEIEQHPTNPEVKQRILSRLADIRRVYDEKLERKANLKVREIREIRPTQLTWSAIGAAIVELFEYFDENLVCFLKKIYTFSAPRRPRFAHSLAGR